MTSKLQVQAPDFYSVLLLEGEYRNISPVRRRGDIGLRDTIPPITGEEKYRMNNKADNISEVTNVRQADIKRNDLLQESADARTCCRVWRTVGWRGAIHRS